MQPRCSRLGYPDTVTGGRHYRAEKGAQEPKAGDFKMEALCRLSCFKEEGFQKARHTGGDPSPPPLRGPRYLQCGTCRSHVLLRLDGRVRVCWSPLLRSNWLQRPQHSLLCLRFCVAPSSAPNQHGSHPSFWVHLNQTPQAFSRFLSSRPGGPTHPYHRDRETPAGHSSGRTKMKSGNKRGRLGREAC